MSAPPIPDHTSLQGGFTIARVEFTDEPLVDALVVADCWPGNFHYDSHRLE